MKIEKGKFVGVSYTLTVNGKEIEKVDAKDALQFELGGGMLLPKFEEHIMGKEVGESFDFKLTAKEAYGEADPKLIIELPLKTFEINGKVDFQMLKEGNMFPMQNSAGYQMNGIVRAVNAIEGKVKMDFNSPLAGQELHFTGKVMEVRDLTEKERIEGIHGEKIQHTCGEGGGCHCSDDGCCSHCH